ncbi:MAG: PrsW family glutamic-type intramembrane protease [Candidatus Rifleibacteriota bacterium]
MTLADYITPVLLFVPILVFYRLFSKNWTDKELKKSFLAGIGVGLICITLARVAYLPVEWFIGEDLRSFISTPREWWITLLASIVIVGLIEEGIKAGGGLLASFITNFNRRPTMLFMAFAGCALGFSLFENLQYYLIFGNTVVIPRLFVSSTAHLYFSCICAAISAKALTRPKADSVISLRIMAGVAVAALFHGLFDFIIFTFEVEAVSGVIIVFVAAFFLGIYESWVSVLKIDDQPGEGLMVCSGCKAFSLGRARFCNFCGSRVILSRRNFSIKLD